MGTTTFTGGGIYTSLPCCRCKYFRVIGRGTGEEGLKSVLTNSRIDAVYLCFREIITGKAKKDDLLYRPDDFILFKRVKNHCGELEDILWNKGKKIKQEGCPYVNN